jgi:hypothetical protein
MDVDAKRHTCRPECSFVPVACSRCMSACLRSVLLTFPRAGPVTANRYVCGSSVRQFANHAVPDCYLIAGWRPRHVLQSLFHSERAETTLCDRPSGQTPRANVTPRDMTLRIYGKVRLHGHPHVVTSRILGHHTRRQINYTTTKSDCSTYSLISCGRSDAKAADQQR